MAGMVGAATSLTHWVGVGVGGSKGRSSAGIMEGGTPRHCREQQGMGTRACIVLDSKLKFPLKGIVTFDSTVHLIQRVVRNKSIAAASSLVDVAAERVTTTMIATASLVPCPSRIDKPVEKSDDDSDGAQEVGKFYAPSVRTLRRIGTGISALVLSLALQHLPALAISTPGAEELQVCTLGAVTESTVLASELHRDTEGAAVRGPVISLADNGQGSFRTYVDSRDGYSFTYPDDWLEVRGAGADVFFRSVYDPDENLFVSVSSPSSSSFKDVTDLGSPEEAGENILKQYLKELMSTRIGVRRKSNLLSARARSSEDGQQQFYEIEANVKSYSATNQLAINPEYRVTYLEWDRRYLSVIGVANNRLYELRLQAPENRMDAEDARLRKIMNSFTLLQTLPTAAA